MWYQHWIFIFLFAVCGNKHECLSVRPSYLFLYYLLLSYSSVMKTSPKSSHYRLHSLNLKLQYQATEIIILTNFYSSQLSEEEKEREKQADRQTHRQRDRKIENKIMCVLCIKIIYVIKEEFNIKPLPKLIRKNAIKKNLNNVNKEECNIKPERKTLATLIKKNATKNP